MPRGALTYNEFMELAKENYNKGGDQFYECWDEAMFNSYVSQFGHVTKTKAKEMFRTAYAVRKDYEATIW